MYIVHSFKQAIYQQRYLPEPSVGLMSPPKIATQKASAACLLFTSPCVLNSRLCKFWLACTYEDSWMTHHWVGVNDTPLFLLNEYIVELNPANFKILNQILNWIFLKFLKFNNFFNWISLNWIMFWIEFCPKFSYWIFYWIEFCPKISYWIFYWTE